MKKVICMLAIYLALTGCGSTQYKRAMSLYEGADYEKASEIFEELGDYENSSEIALNSQYTYATKLLEDKNSDTSKEIFVQLGNYTDSKNFCKEFDHQKAEEALASGDYETVISLHEAVSGHLESERKIPVAKKTLTDESYSDVINLMTTGVWFYNGGSDSVVNRLTFSDATARIVQIAFDGNIVAVTGDNELPYLVDESNITLTLVDGSEQVIPYTLEDDTLVLDDGYLTPADIDADLQGYWGVHTRNVVLGIATEKECIFHFDNGKVVYEYAVKAYGGRNGEYYYYGPYEGTYTVDERGLKTDAKNSWQFAFNVIDGKAVFTPCGDVCSPVSGFKGENGYRF